jgi:carboxyl-terminal processing protease
MHWKFSLTSLTLLACLLTSPAARAQSLGAVGGDAGSAASTSEAQAKPDALYQQVWALVDRVYYDATDNGQKWERWQHRYDDKLKTMDDAYLAINTMLASLNDRYTRFLNPEAWKGENSQISAQLFGVGIQIAPDKNHNIVVVAPIEGTPAAKAGLMPLDQILEVNGKSTKGLAAEAVSQQIRGPMGTEVTLKVLRGKQEMTFKLTRAEIHVRAVEAVKMLDGGIGYVRLSTFMSQTAGDEVKAALSQLSPARGVILDLRGNPGGLVTNAIEICNIFLDGGVIVSTIDRNGHIQPAGAHSDPFYRKPLVVLINAGSASASEITSGALKDNGRAQLVGETSFGKGLVQSVNALQGDCGVNITIARYLTPSGTDIHKKGIAPDYEVKLAMPGDYLKGNGPWWMDPGGPLVHRSPDDGKDLQMKKAIEVLRDKIENTQQPDQIQLDSPLLHL